jgi:hypothetical protein
LEKLIGMDAVAPGPCETLSPAAVFLRPAFAPGQAATSFLAELFDMSAFAVVKHNRLSDLG